MAVNVLTLRQGTVSDLRDLRGTGPFRRYDVSPDHLLHVVETAAHEARGAGGHRVEGVWASERRLEVIAKERAPEDQARTSYDLPWRSAMVATIHRVPGEPGASLLEVHAKDRGPFDQGVVRWERDLPRWIDEVLDRGRRGDDGENGVRPLR